MKILAAEDDPVARKILATALKQLGHDVVVATDGNEAWKFLQADPMRVVVSDWQMPEMDGLNLCRRIRARANAEYVYFILLTATTDNLDNRRAATDAGVDDFLAKPLDVDELWMRLRVAERILRYATQVRQLEQLLPICAYCKKVRDDKDYWQQIEGYINARTGSEFSHSVCPECYDSILKPQIEQMRAEAKAKGIKVD